MAMCIYNIHFGFTSYNRTSTFGFTSYNRRCITSFRHPELSRGLRLVSRSNRFIVDIVVSLSESQSQSDGGCMWTCTFIHLKSSNLHVHVHHSVCTGLYNYDKATNWTSVSELQIIVVIKLCLSVAPYWKCGIPGTCTMRYKILHFWMSYRYRKSGGCNITYEIVGTHTL